MGNEKNEFRLLAYVDGELSEEEESEFESLLRDSPDLQAEVEAYRRMRKATKEIHFRTPPPEFWDEYPRGVLARLQRGVGWLCFALGSLALLLAAFVSMWLCPELGLQFKIPFSLVAIGLSVLLASVAKQRWKEAKKDPYKGIIR